MKLSTFKQHLQSQADKQVGFAFDDGDTIPEQFHVTEVGHVVKNFIDCGGTIRRVATVQLQIWLGEDAQHRLTAGKLTKIIGLAGALIPSDDLDVEVEYEGCVVSQYTVEEAIGGDAQIVFRLGDKHTDCLARESCGLSPAGAATGCCGGSSCG